MKPVIVDFETYYDGTVSVVTQGIRNYSRDSDAYILAVITPEWEFCGTMKELVDEHGDSWMTDPDLQFWAANSNFDQAFWEKYFPKTAHPWMCVLDWAAFHQLPRALEGVVRVQLKIKMDKSVRSDMKGVHFEDLTPEAKAKVEEYCLTDARMTEQLLRSLPPMSPVEAQLAAHTRLVNRRGLRVDLERVERDLTCLEEVRWLARKRIPWIEESDHPLSYPRFARFCELAGLVPPKSLDKRDVACGQWMIDNPEQAKIIESMRNFRGANSKREKLRSIVAAADNNSIIPLDLIYCGARHTRRWSSKNINVQNLDAKPVFEEEMAELDWFKLHPEVKPGIWMREYLLPPPGQVFGILDFSQIEPRCLNWMVGNDEMLGAIRKGYGIYEAHAKATMGWKGDAGTLKHTDPARYKFAKERVLSLGYGMGAQRFQARAKTNLGLDLSLEQAQDAVTDFRESNPRIVDQWKKFQMIILAAQRSEDRTIEITMPTGDLLKHFRIRGKGMGKGYESLTIRDEESQASRIDNLFGGLLTENTTQRMARDVLGEAILRLEQAGIEVAFHAHDEIIMNLPEATAAQDFEDAKAIMSQCPDWCPDLPLAVDGEIHNTYTKLQ